MSTRNVSTCPPCSWHSFPKPSPPLVSVCSYHTCTHIESFTFHLSQFSPCLQPRWTSANVSVYRALMSCCSFWVDWPSFHTRVCSNHHFLDHHGLVGVAVGGVVGICIHRGAHGTRHECGTVRHVSMESTWRNVASMGGARARSAPWRRDGTGWKQHVLTFVLASERFHGHVVDVVPGGP